ncbi:hypothetical protein AB5J55_44405 [Streptomyces sp. R11]|uniref:Transposase n=1 Tax=Streptomyces sp. R11 TaxID=3238625 RepID=A0AB39NCB5_9ACTN
MGRASALGRRLRTVSERHGYPVGVDKRYGRVRAWMRRREAELPTVEELMVTAPYHVQNKQVGHFEREWRAYSWRGLRRRD